MLNDHLIRQTLAALGAKLRTTRDVEILIIGGAAGLLTGVLPPLGTTEDVDLLDCQLPQDRDAVFEAAAAITARLSLPAGWMNDFGGLFRWSLPSDWRTRRVLIGRFDQLTVYAVGRHDLITMKFLAHRRSDLEHLRQMNVTAGERDAAINTFDQIEKDAPESANAIAMARVVARDWQVAL